MTNIKSKEEIFPTIEDMRESIVIHGTIDQGIILGLIEDLSLSLDAALAQNN
jgi:hypothetical protein